MTRQRREELLQLLAAGQEGFDKSGEMCVLEGRLYLASLASRSSGAVEDARPSSESRTNAPSKSRDARVRRILRANSRLSANQDVSEAREDDARGE